MQARTWLALGALLCALAVALGAFGAHGLKDVLQEGGHVATWETASRYHLLHGLALFATGLAARELSRNVCRAAGVLFALGMLLFSGSLYWLALGGPAWLGPVTPLGGTCLIAGWIVLAVGALRGARQG
jgi:uncharacterized membrane protein YgdD (TMEM256/DUF423 family)